MAIGDAPNEAVQTEAAQIVVHPGRTIPGICVLRLVSIGVTQMVHILEICAPSHHDVITSVMSIRR